MRSCKLILKDEVNCKFEGLDAETRRKCSAALKFFKPGARYSFAYKMGRWDGRVSFFNAVNGETYINLLDRVLPVIEEAMYDIEIEDRRLLIDVDFQMIDENFLSDIVWPAGHRFEGEPVILEEHQVRIVNALLSNQHAVVEAATGAGKTAISAALARNVSPYGRMIVVVPNIDLVEQTAGVFNQMNVETGMFYGGVKELTKPATICTWHSISAFYKKPRGMDQLTPEEVAMALEGTTSIICDEAHTMKGEILKGLFTNQFNRVPIRWGLTGTIPKEELEAISLELAIGPCVLKVETKELQDKGFLADADINILHLKDDRKFVDYPAEIEGLLFDEERMSYIANLTKEISETGNTLLLIDRVEPGKMLTSELQNLGIDAEFVFGGIKNKVRKARYADVQAGHNTVTVATFGVASVGIDIQRLHNVIFLEPGKAFTRVMQSFGRGLRKGSDKEKVQIYDICSSTKYSNKHMRDRCKYYREKEQKHTIYKITDWRSYA